MWYSAWDQSLIALDQHLDPKKMSAAMETLYICTTQDDSRLPHVAIEHLKYTASVSEKLNL